MYYSMLICTTCHLIVLLAVTGESRGLFKFQKFHKFRKLVESHTIYIYSSSS